MPNEEMSVCPSGRGVLNLLDELSTLCGVREIDGNMIGKTR